MSNFEVYLLVHQSEQHKNSNTAPVVAEQLGEQCQIINWSRVEPDKALVEKIVSGNYHSVLLFAHEFACETQGVLTQVPEASDKPMLFILLDGTWQQSRKMLRQSPYLHDLPMLQLSSEQPSQYQLRRNQREEGLCTVETVIELCKQLGDDANAAKLQQGFEVFLKDYYAHCHEVNGVRPKK